ncbi:MAG: hypothetical protein J6R75_01635 [Candidatus Methanomethylophilaceae archaeon]|jgi:hypothetical protein|nr:hypothetical protein [Candidatus Methanomethylophilaceae archaeon]
MMSEERRFRLLVYLIIGIVVGVALSGLFVYMTGSHFYWIFIPLSAIVVLSQGWTRTKKGLE